MADAYWRYNDPRQAPPPMAAPPPLVAKRPRSEYDVPPGRDPVGYYSHEDDRASHRPLRDADPVNPSYECYYLGGQLPYAGSEAGRLPASGMPGRPVDDHLMRSDPRIAGHPSVGVMDPFKGRDPNLGSGRHEIPLPADASNTLFVECLPANCTRREVSHIFRPFVGYKEVRLVTKESRHSGGDALVLCFVDFVSAPHAATAMDALQGYKFDENDRDSAILRLQFARFPGARSNGGGGGGGHRKKR